MKKILSLLFLALLLFSNGAWVAANVKTETFPYRFQQQLSLTSNATFFLLEFPSELFAKMDPSLRDLRIYSGGKELGYTSVPVNEMQKQERSVEILNQGIEAEGSHSFEMRLPADMSGDKEGHLKVFLTPAPYFVKGELYGGIDGHSWKKLKDITLFSIDQQVNEIALTGIQYPYIKIVYRPMQGAAGWTGEGIRASEVRLLRTTIKGTTNSTVEKCNFSPSRDVEKRVSYVLADLKYRNRLTDQITVQTDEKGFYRQVTLEGSQDGEKWTPILSTYLYRGTGAGDEKLTIPYEPCYDRYLRLKIQDEDNSPLQVNGVESRVYPVQILVKAPASPTSFTLEGYFGNQRLQPPSYDVSNVLKESGWRDFSLVKVTSYEENPSYNPLKALPLTERYPYLLTVGLILVVFAVLFVLYRTMKSVKK